MMRRPVVLLALGGIALATLATGPASASGPTVGSFSVPLSGAQEVPPADPDGSGRAGLALDGQLNRVCYGIQVSNIAPATAAHIHKAPAGVNGPVVVHLLPPRTGQSGGCAFGAQAGIVQEMIDTPSNFYVNVHNPQYPGGAVRGQLSGA